VGSGTSSKALPVGAWSALRSDWSFTNMSVKRSQCQLNKIGKPVKFCGLPVLLQNLGFFRSPSLDIGRSIGGRSLPISRPADAA
jgi:hypothetical protein